MEEMAAAVAEAASATAEAASAAAVLAEGGTTGHDAILLLFIIYTMRRRGGRGVVEDRNNVFVFLDSLGALDWCIDIDIFVFGWVRKMKDLVPAATMDHGQ